MKCFTDNNAADSLRIVEGTGSLLPPYIALGFDQEARYREMTPKQHITMGEMEKLQWLAGYGRPLCVSSKIFYRSDNQKGGQHTRIMTGYWSWRLLNSSTNNMKMGT